MWANYVEKEEEEKPAENEPTERNVSYKTVVVTEVGKDLKFFAQNCDNGKLKRLPYPPVSSRILSSKPALRAPVHFRNTTQLTPPTPPPKKKKKKMIKKTPKTVLNHLPLPELRPSTIHSL